MFRLHTLLRTAVVVAVTALANVACAAENTVVSQSIALLQDCEFAGGGLHMGPSEAGNLPTKAALQIDADHAPLGTVGPLSLQFEARDYTRHQDGSVFVSLSRPDGWRAFASDLWVHLMHGDLERCQTAVLQIVARQDL
jgi:hypothetical protein